MYELAIIAIVVAIVCLFIMVQRQKSEKRKAASPPADAPAYKAESIERAGQTKVLPVGMLIAKSGSHRGMVFAVEPSGLKIGRDRSRNQIVIDSDVVSREHAWIGLEEGKVVIKDLDSRNGTYINSLEGARIQAEDLKDGDVIYIGKNGAESFKYKAG